MIWGNDVYYHAEQHGLTIIAEIDDEQSCYSFDLTVVWKNEATGDKYWAADSGCSCPSPFENYTSVEALTPLRTDADWDRLTNHLMEYDRANYPLAEANYPLAEVNRFLYEAKER